MLAATPVGAELEGKEARLVRRFEHDGASAVAEQDDRGPVAPVEDPGEHVATDHERSPCQPGDDHSVRLSDRVHEPRTAGGQVVRGRLRGAEPIGEDRGRGGEHHVRRDGRDDDQVDVLALEAGLAQCRLCGR